MCDRFHSTTAPVRKLEPSTVIVNQGPRSRGKCVTDVTTGVGVSIENGVALLAAPSGLKTNTAAVPVVVIDSAGTCAVNWPALTNVVASGDPLKYATAPRRNPVPFTVSANPWPRANAKLGLSPEILRLPGGTAIR